jgi:hypothetical protein
MRIVRSFLVALHLLVGVGAVVGGLAAILDPMKPLGMPFDSLENFPFDSFLIPGIILFGLIGIGNLVALVPILIGRRWFGYTSGFFACSLMGWITVQCLMLGVVAALHVIFFCIGVAMGCLALAQLSVEGLWPGTWLARLVAFMRREP